MDIELDRPENRPGPEPQVWVEQADGLIVLRAAEGRRPFASSFRQHAKELQLQSLARFTRMRLVEPRVRA
jgi:hypothetical protein